MSVQDYPVHKVTRLLCNFKDKQRCHPVTGSGKITGLLAGSRFIITSCPEMGKTSPVGTQAVNKNLSGTLWSPGIQLTHLDRGP